MRVLLIGASGAIGTHLTRQLAEQGHEVTGTSRSAAKASQLKSLGAQPVTLDVLDAPALRAVLAENHPDVVIYQATALAGARFGRSLDKTFAATNRLRTQGTDNVISAAGEAGVRKVIAQSFAPYRYAPDGDQLMSEDDPLLKTPPASARETFAAMSHLDEAVLAAGGIALRYGGFYSETDQMVTAVRKRQYPLVGEGSGIMPFIHLHDAAAATVLALNAEGPAIYNITDDDPAPMRDWLPALAAALGAKPPRRVPAWLARLIVGGEMLAMSNSSPGVSNAKAKKELGMSLRYPSWREGFPASFRH